MPDPAEKVAEELIKELRLGIMATPGIITVKDKWRVEVLVKALRKTEQRVWGEARLAVMDKHIVAFGKGHREALIYLNALIDEFRRKAQEVKEG